MRNRRLSTLGAAIALLAVVAPGYAQSGDAVLPGRPDAAASVGDALDPAFLSTSAGISVRPPSGGKMIRRGGGGDEVVRFVNEEAKWSFAVSRVLLAEPVPLTTPIAPGTAADAKPDAPPAQTGFADLMAGQMPSDTPGKLVRSELTPINGFDGALLASRFSERNEKRLMQQAVIRRTDKAYYVLTYTTAIGTGELESDPAAARALETFSNMVDSVELIDQEAIAQDQTDRLLRTRALMVNWTPKRLRGVLVPEQWLRLIKDGKDVGYTYIVEEPADDLPRSGTKQTGVAGRAAGELPEGVRIGIRSRTLPDASYVVDAESWLWVRFDSDAERTLVGKNERRQRQQQESFRNQVVTTEAGKLDADGKPAKPNYAMEVGTSVLRDRVIPVRVQVPGAVQPRIEQRVDERIELQVYSSSNLQQMEPVKKEVPPYYLPQAMVHLLPRLLPLREARTYLFASYVPETRQVMTRYVDVLGTTTVDLGGTTHTAVPVRERAGLEGSVTTHYLTPDGTYLGSVNDDNRIVILPSDPKTILSIWKDAKLERPGDVDDAKR